MNLPNKLTIARVIMIPLFLICLYLNIGCGKYIAVGINSGHPNATELQYNYGVPLTVTWSAEFLVGKQGFEPEPGGGFEPEY